MSMHKKANLVGTIESLLQAVGGDTVKTAATKRAASYTEAGGYTGGTTHPSKDVDDRAEAASEGARSAENTEDVKSEPNRGAVVDSVTPGPGAGQDSVQMDVGITSKATGEDSAAETSSAKDGKDDPGSSHPARTDNEALDGHKYASELDYLAALCKKAEKQASDICAWIATADTKTPEPSSKKVAAANPAEVKPAPEVPAKVAAEKGYDLAGLFADIDVPAEDKVAVDRMVVDTLEEVIETALRRAEKCAMYYAGRFGKAAEGEELPPEAGGGEGGPPPEAAAGGEGGGGGQISPEEEQLLMQLLQGGEGMGAEDAMAGMGGGDPAAAGMGGGDPAAAGMGGGDPLAALGGGGGAPAGGAGGDPLAAMGGGGAEGGGEVDPAMLEQILAELGVSPQEVQAKMSAAHKQAAAKAKAKWQPKTAADREKYARMKQVITEITGRSRA